MYLTPRVTGNTGRCCCAGLGGARSSTVGVPEPPRVIPGPVSRSSTVPAFQHRGRSSTTPAFQDQFRVPVPFPRSNTEGVPVPPPRSRTSFAFQYRSRVPAPGAFQYHPRPRTDPGSSTVARFGDARGPSSPGGVPGPRASQNRDSVPGRGGEVPDDFGTLSPYLSDCAKFCYTPVTRKGQGDARGTLYSTLRYAS